MFKRFNIVVLVMVCIAILGYVSLYTSIYPRTAVKILQRINQYQLNPIAAQSQQSNPQRLQQRSHFEEGSPKWLARQVYLDLMWQKIEQQRTDELVAVYTAYHALLAEIEQQPFVSSSQRKDEYHQFLMNYIEKNQSHVIIDEGIFDDITILYQQHANEQQGYISLTRPVAIVVLGGGLTRDKQTKQIVLNQYTKKRLQQVLEVKRNYPDVPVLLSGVESSYMQTYLKSHGIKADFMERKSLNTCENARFSALLLQKKGGASTILLITDEYHLPRSQRLFAENGINTIPVMSAMPTSVRQGIHAINYDHSRRANYEILASVRDRIFGSGECREVPE